MLLVIKYPSDGMVALGVKPGDLFELTDVVKDEDVCPIHGREHPMLFEVRLIGSPSKEWQAQPWRFGLEGSASAIVATSEITLH